MKRVVENMWNLRNAAQVLRLIKTQSQQHYVSYELYDVFTQTRFGGNQLAVVLDQWKLTTKQMQSIARELNISETAFVVGWHNGFRVRFFTPEKELPFAGHPTLGTAAAIAKSQGAKFDKETDITLLEGFGKIQNLTRINTTILRTSAHLSNVSLQIIESPIILGKHKEFDPTVISLPSAQIGNSILARPLIATAGVPFTIIPVRDVSALAEARINLQVWHDKFEGSQGPHLYLVAPRETNSESQTEFQVRMFAPMMGISEDPATGAGAAAFAGILAADHKRGRFIIHQGVEMGRPSILELTVANPATDGFHTKLSGDVIRVGGGRLFLD